MSPLKPLLSVHDALIVTSPVASVLAPLRLAFNCALFCSIPVGFYHIWRFVAPGLYHRERVVLSLAFLGSLSLFCVGVIFCFYAVLPFMFQLFMTARPAGVRFMPDMSVTIDFMLHMLMVFGLCFQLPLVCAVLVRLNVLTLGTLKAMRPYMIVMAFVVGMLLTPPDVLSQLMLAIPLCLLYELGIMMSIVMQHR